MITLTVTLQTVLLISVLLVVIASPTVTQATVRSGLKLQNVLLMFVAQSGVPVV